MVDRILHIGHHFAHEYDKELLQGAAEVYIKNGKGAVAPYLVNTGEWTAADAEKLSRKIHVEMVRVNRSILLYYSSILAIFLLIAGFSISTESYIFAALFLLPALRILYSFIKFIRRNPLQ
jgi:hypothetical protein